MPTKDEGGSLVALFSPFELAQYQPRQIPGHKFGRSQLVGQRGFLVQDIDNDSIECR